MASSYLLRSMHTTLQIIKCDPNGEVSRRRTRDEKIKKTEAGIGGLQALMTHAGKFIKKYNILDITCRGKMEQSQQQTLTPWVKVSRKLMKQCCTK